MNPLRTTAPIILLPLLLSCLPASGRDRVVTVKTSADSQAPGYESAKAMDGNPATMWHTRWQTGETGHPHQLVLDLGKSYEIDGFTYLPRPGGGNGTIKEYEFHVSDSKKDFGKPVAKGAFSNKTGLNTVKFRAKAAGRYVKLRALSEAAGRPWTSVAELRLLSKGVRFSADPSSAAAASMVSIADPTTEAEMQYEALRRDLRNRKRFEAYAPQTFNMAASILSSDRDPADVVLRRTRALLDDIKGMSGAPDLSALGQELLSLAEAGSEIDPADAEARLDLFKNACALRRRIAFSNPLLDFDRILFIKRHRSKFNHMCDQYYATHAVPGGGLFVLSDPFSDHPEGRDVLAGSVVQRGRLQGTKLEGGSFVSPDLSYDGRTILFSYVECTGDRSHLHHTDHSRGHWTRGRCYHIFKVDADGSGLEQLTDGTWNDFDPCWMPNGRIVFISERRGGYLRCGRACPTYTLHDMNPDGSDILCLSPHETNEWHPSITHDGMILYTRWDYVDRHGCVAHHPWITTPDGRDSRAVHGNFSPRQSRADMELSLRAVPGSRKFSGTAAPHHGQAYGSIILIDPSVEDDDAMAPVKRVTPDVAFPESQGGGQVYGTPWPLSENYYLCVYDSQMKPGIGRQGRRHVSGNYGIYLVDAFGNKELIYRDPGIACLDPMPLRPRTMPPVVPPASERHARNPPSEGTLAVLNVYDALKPWPEGTKIETLRVYQIIPMSVPSGSPPHEVGMRLPGDEGRDSVILARYVLGTVPVEEDGSAHFVAPAMKELFFQALDEEGLAIQSMRSSTYLQPGERLVCQGCHEPRHSAPKLRKAVPLALKRPPSRLTPDVDGTNPFSYPRLVQPVLDKHCVQCHEEEQNSKQKPPRLTADVVNKGRQKWYRSYHSLAPAYGFWKYGDPHRTTPGRFGARASKLYAMLKKGHHDVKLSREEMHRITLWLDSCSVFYGVYEKEGGEAQLRGEVVKPTLE